MNKKVKQSLQNLEKAVQRLEEAVVLTGNDALRVDGTIQRFEFTFELCWKTMKRVFEAEGIQVSTPRETLARAYQVQWIHHEKVWLHMLEDRNLTSHVYSETEAHHIFDRIHHHYLAEFKPLLVFLKQHCAC